jgi:hypothetical protein
VGEKGVKLGVWLSYVRIFAVSMRPSYGLFGGVHGLTFTITDIALPLACETRP